MTRRTIVRIAPWQAGRLLAVLYFVVGAFAAAVLAITGALTPDVPGQPEPGWPVFVAMPIIYAVAGLIFVPLGCWLYNTLAGVIGGIEVTVRDSEVGGMSDPTGP